MNWRFHLSSFFLFLGGVIFTFSFSPFAFWIFWPSFLAFWLIFSFPPAYRAFRFSRKKGVSFNSSFFYGLLAFFHYPYFLWIIRPILPLEKEERENLILESSRITRVKRPSSFFCPFCKVEITHALQTTTQGGITTKKVPLLCPRCETRLDVCRYCSFLEMTPESGWLKSSLRGKCTVIKKNQAVEDICPPSISRRLQEMGWHTLYSGIPITDPFYRPENCRYFRFDETKTSSDGIPCMGKARYLLLKIEEELYSHSSSGSCSS
ncbi:MAG: hypothetical protein ACUVQZ_03145 [Candidatus Caldatribacteriaceae bacterium]